jgi:hypothetical protein
MPTRAIRPHGAEGANLGQQIPSCRELPFDLFLGASMRGTVHLSLLGDISQERCAVLLPKNFVVAGVLKFRPFDFGVDEFDPFLQPLW